MFARGAAPLAAQQIAARFPERSAATARVLDRLQADPDDPAAPVALIGCGYARRAPEVAADAARAVASLLGRPARLLRACCGLPLLHAGDHTGFVAAARRLVDEIARASRLVVVDPGCARALLVEYPRVGVEVSEAGSPRAVPRPELFVDLAARHRDRLAPLGGAPTFRWHDPCQLGRGLDRYDEPRAVLARLAGKPPLELQRTRREGECSGGGGLLPATRPESANAIASSRVAEHRALGGGVLVTGCAQSLHRYRRAGEHAEDIVTLVARALGG